MAVGNYTIILEDGGGMEFFFTKEKKLVLFSDMSAAEPEWFDYKNASNRLDKHRPNYAAVCHLFIVFRRDFEQRRATVRAETQAAKEARAAHRAWLDSLPDPDPSQ